MNNSFKDRETAFESKYAHDEEFKFRAISRRNKLLGLWVAPQLGLTSESSADSYAKSVVAANVGKSDQEVVAYVLNEMDSELDVTESEVVKKMEELLKLAVEELAAETE